MVVQPRTTNKIAVRKRTRNKAVVQKRIENESAVSKKEEKKLAVRKQVVKNPQEKIDLENHDPGYKRTREEYRVSESIGVYIDALELSYVWCKTIGHAWDEFTPHMKRAQFGYRLSLLCVRCTAERHDIVSIIDGRLLQREYRYPEGYKLAMKYSRDEFRKVLIQRIRRRDRQSRTG